MLPLLLLLALHGCESQNERPALGSAPPAASDDDPAVLVFTADLRGENVAPDPVDTDADAVATATLEGNKLTVNGSFINLSSQLRDIEETPEDPGIHLHPGPAGEAYSYLYGLQAQLNDDERSGTFTGTVELTDDELALLLAGDFYIDIHTVEHYPGELRDQWHAADPEAVQRRIHQLRQQHDVDNALDRVTAALPQCPAPDVCNCQSTLAQLRDSEPR